MSPIGIPHAACVRRLNAIFNFMFRGKAIVDTQNPMELNDDSQPQPDLMLLRWRDDFEDIFLLVEVADSIAKSDREVKIPMYAENGIIEVWLIDISNNKKSNKLSYRNHQLFPPIPYSLFPIPYSLFPHLLEMSNRYSSKISGSLPRTSGK